MARRSRDDDDDDDSEGTAEAKPKTELDSLLEEGQSINHPTNDSRLEDTNVDDDDKQVSLYWNDVQDTVVLAGPIFLAMLSWVGMKTIDSGLLGHVSVQALSAAALSDLWTMCTVVLLQGNVLGVLTGAASGANNPQLAGVYLQISYLVLTPVMLFVMFAWWFGTERIWIWWGGSDVDHDTAHMAGYYAKVLAASLPGQLIFDQLRQFFSSQRIVEPVARASGVALLANLVFGMIFVLGIQPFFRGWSGFGFAACPIVTSTVVYVQLFFLWFVYIHLQKFHAPFWGGWSWKEITQERIMTFSKLYFPAALGIASDFWRVAVIGAVAAKLGEQEVSLFNTGYRVMWITMISINALATASSIKMTQRLGKMDTNGAKRAAQIVICLSIAFLVVVGCLVYWKTSWFGRIFTNDQNFLVLFEDVRLPFTFTITLVLMNLSVAIERVPIACGRTAEVFWYGLVASWAAQVPAVIFYTRYCENSLNALYWGMATGYGVLVLLYSYITITGDWKYYAELARQRSEVSTNS